MENNKNTDNDLHQEAPMLSTMGGENHFPLPQNYFKSLPEVMSGKILNNNNLWFYFDKMSYHTLIPSGAFLILVFVFLNWNSNTLDSELSEVQLSELLLEEAYTDMDAYLIYDTLHPPAPPHHPTA